MKKFLKIFGGIIIALVLLIGAGLIYFDYFSGPVVAGTEGKGGMEFPDLAGTFYPSNITPAALSNWTDGEIIRAITVGVNKEGAALFPMMPYPMYKEMAQEDVEAIVAYIRALPAIQNDVPKSKINFPLNLILSGKGLSPGGNRI